MFEKAYNDVFNVGADIPYTINQLIEKIKVIMGNNPDIKYLEQRNEVVHAYSSHEKAEKVFGLNNKTDLETGLKIMADWVKIHGAKKTKNFQDIEIEENLPPSWKES